jgi:enoyl-CoA hydratase/carnithine racemase
LQGYVLGGGAELMLATDLRIATEDARFGFPEVKVGGFPAAGGVWRLARDIGPVRAKELLLFGRIIPAQQAHELHMINEYVAKEQLGQRLRQIVDELLALPQSSLLAIKRTVALASTAPAELFSGAPRVTDEYGKLFRGRDIFEGIQAFLEKRPPCFNLDSEAK